MAAAGEHLRGVARPRHDRIELGRGVAVAKGWTQAVARNVPAVGKDDEVSRVLTALIELGGEYRED